MVTIGTGWIPPPRSYSPEPSGMCVLFSGGKLSRSGLQGSWNPIQEENSLAMPESRFPFQQTHLSLTHPSLLTRWRVSFIKQALADTQEREVGRGQRGKSRKQDRDWPESNKDQDRNGEWGAVSGDTEMETVAAVCLSLSLRGFSREENEFPLTLKEKHLGGEIFSRWQCGLSYTELCFDEWQNVLLQHVSRCLYEEEKCFVTLISMIMFICVLWIYAQWKCWELPQKGVRVRPYGVNV